MARKGKGIKFSVKCPAKINLFLRVIGRRDDGYHDIETLFVPINIYDDLSVTPASRTYMVCDAAGVPTNSRNIIFKVDKILREEYALAMHFRIDLVKRIPVGAGLGGGSSDAAGYLTLVDKVAGLGLADGSKREILDRVGSDTVFFLNPEPSVGSGRGTCLTPAACLPEFYLLIVNPMISVSTKEAYSSPDLVFTARDRIPKIEKPLNFDQMTSLMKNDMELPIFNMYGKIRELKERFESLGYGKSLMSGSGSTVFGVYETPEERDAACDFFRAEYPDYYVRKAEAV